MVFYRKYRPQKIEELDSSEVREKLYSVLKSPSVAHAFLFTGPKGLGKTSAARIVAKVLNCEKKTKGVEPCNKCEQCKSITNGTNMDILEIDGASNRGIDEIRDLREKIRLSPLSARKKVYIIDEVHMLTQEAFNALLKTLEEPPSHVVFILCTTEPHKVPSTILSRCLHIQFRKATQDELVRSFERIVKAEKIKGDLEALNLIASLSDGSFRDGSKLLEEIVLLAGRKKITKELVEKKYKVSSIRYQVSKILEFLENRDTKSSLELVSKLVEQGADMKFFMETLISELHAMLLDKVGIETDAKKTELTIENIKHLIELSGKAIGELKYAVLPQIPLELVIVEWGLQAEIITEQTTDIKKETVVNNTPIISTQQNIGNYNSNNALWTALIDKVKFYNHSIAGVLRGCTIKSYDGNSLTIEAKFKFHKDKLSEKKTQEILQEACREITKKNIKIEILLRDGGERK